MHACFCCSAIWVARLALPLTLHHLLKRCSCCSADSDWRQALSCSRLLWSLSSLWSVKELINQSYLYMHMQGQCTCLAWSVQVRIVVLQSDIVKRWRTYHTFAQCCTVYVGFAQARFNYCARKILKQCPLLIKLRPFSLIVVRETAYPTLSILESLAKVSHSHSFVLVLQPERGFHLAYHQYISTSAQRGFHGTPGTTLNLLS